MCHSHKTVAKHGVAHYGESVVDPRFKKMNDEVSKVMFAFKYADRLRVNKTTGGVYMHLAPGLYNKLCSHLGGDYAFKDRLCTHEKTGELLLTLDVPAAVTAKAVTAVTAVTAKAVTAKAVTAKAVTAKAVTAVTAKAVPNTALKPANAVTRAKLQRSFKPRVSKIK